MINIKQLISLTYIQRQATLGGSEAGMESSATKNAAPNINKILCIIVEKRLTDQKATPDDKHTIRSKFIRIDSLNKMTYCLAACCLSMIS